MQRFIYSFTISQFVTRFHLKHLTNSSKKHRVSIRNTVFLWCERWDSNPHGITTRTSNVLVYHSNTLANMLKYYNLRILVCQYLFLQNKGTVPDILHFCGNLWFFCGTAADLFRTGAFPGFPEKARETGLFLEFL